MLKPPKPLPSGGRIGVLGLSSTAGMETMEKAAALVRTRGFEVTFAPNLFEDDRGYLAGTDDRRISVLHSMLDDDEIDAFFFSRGGYGIGRILDRIDYDRFARNHRPVVGYSDVTALHQALARAELASFHGPMLDFDIATGLSLAVEEWMWQMLSGASPMILPIEQSNVYRGGVAEGTLFGGCLSLTSSLAGTPFDFWIDDGIWFWEDVGEPAYRIDRMLTHLRLSGRFDSLRAVLIGGLKDCGKEPSEIDILVGDFFGELDVPVLTNLPFGHNGDNIMMPIGRQVRIDTEAGSITMTESAVSMG